MLRIWAALSAACLLAIAPHGARADDLVFLSTQLRPVEEAQRVREIILKNFPGHVQYVTEFPANLPVRVQAEQQGGQHTISLIGALHGELQSLVPINGLAPLDDLAARLGDRGIPASLMQLGKLGTQHTLYIPWMQATYVMAASKQALQYLPEGADINALTYDQLAAWSEAIQAKTGKRVLGFPAGPQGLMPRFFEGYLYPSYTGGVVRSFRSPDAVAMWTAFAKLWKSVNPNSASYNFMQEPLLAGDVWIAWDHVARLQDALRQRPNDFVVFPAPAGPKGRGIMPVVVGLAVSKDAPDAAGAASLIDYLTKPETQIVTVRTSGFFPVSNIPLPNDLDPGLKLEADAVAKAQSAKDALVTLLPVGLGAKGGEFDKVFMDSFQRIVLRGDKPEAVLDREAQDVRRIMNDTKAPCWAPDAPSEGACPVQ
jgi:multiple sugar transport system substrate-binding protein